MPTSILLDKKSHGSFKKKEKSHGNCSDISFWNCVDCKLHRMVNIDGGLQVILELCGLQVTYRNLAYSGFNVMAYSNELLLAHLL